MRRLIAKRVLAPQDAASLLAEAVIRRLPPKMVAKAAEAGGKYDAEIEFEVDRDADGAVALSTTVEVFYDRPSESS